MTEPRITLTDADDPGIERALLGLLAAHNAEHAGPPAWRPLSITLAAADGAITGGLTGGSFYGWTFIHLFFVPSALRGKGMGSRLLRMAEEEARARGCIGVHLDTFSFQARPFYERHGYRVYGTIGDFPAGHMRYYLSKRIA